MAVAEAHALGAAQGVGVEAVDAFLEVGDLLHLLDEPGIEAGDLTDRGGGVAAFERFVGGEEAVAVGDAQQIVERGVGRVAFDLALGVPFQRTKAVSPNFEAAHALL